MYRLSVENIQDAVSEMTLCWWVGGVSVILTRPGARVGRADDSSW